MGVLCTVATIAVCAVSWYIGSSPFKGRPSFERETDFSQLSAGCVLMAPFEEVLVEDVKPELKPRIFLINKRTKEVVRSWSIEFSPTTARIDEKGNLWVINKMFWERVPPVHIQVLDPSSHIIETVAFERIGLDFDITPRGVVFSQFELKKNPMAETEREFKYHRVVEYDTSTKQIVWEFDLLKEMPFLFSGINDQQNRSRDMTHINSIRYIAKNPLTQTPAILFIARNLSEVFLIDQQSRKVLWSSKKQFDFPHDAQFLDNGNLLLFNNRTSPVYSSVVQWDILENKKVWQYTSITEVEFHSAVFGSASRLKNGNTLITEGIRGHIFEVSPMGEVVWEFFQTIEKLDRRRSWPIVPLFRAENYEPDFVKSLGWGDICS